MTVVQTEGFCIHRYYAEVVENADGDGLCTFLEENVEKGTTVRTDGWTGYKSGANDFQLVQERSDNGKARKAGA